MKLEDFTLEECKRQRKNYYDLIDTCKTQIGNDIIHKNTRGIRDGRWLESYFNRQLEKIEGIIKEKES